jgi:hypothetical protein
MGADSLTKSTPNAPEFICPSSKILDFNEKRLHWASVVRALVHGFACIVATLGNSVCGDTIGFRTNIQQSLKSNNDENTWRYLNGKSKVLL